MNSSDTGMRILFLCSARRWGGNEKWTHMAAENLAQHHQVLLAYRSQEVGDRFHIPKFRLSFKFEGDLVTLNKLYHIVRKHDIQILVPTKPKDYVLAGIVARILHRKNVARLGIVKAMTRPVLYRLVYGFLLDGIIVNAEVIKSNLLNALFMQESKIRRIYNGLDQAEIRTQSEAFAVKKPFHWMAIAVGELSPRKNIDTLLKSFAVFIRQNNICDAGLWIVGGKGTYMDYLKNLSVKLGIENEVIFTGYVQNPCPYMKQSDVFVSCSLNEGISNALLEAMALQSVVITTEAGGTREIIQNNVNGLLFSLDDANALSRLLLHIYQHPQKTKQLKQAAKATIENQFSIRRMTSELETYFNELTR